MIPAKRPLPSKLLSWAFVIWAFCWLALFIIFPGSFSILHGSSLYDLRTFVPVIAPIAALEYVSDLGKALIGMLAFAMSCLGFGMLALRIQNTASDLPSTTTLQGLAKLSIGSIVGGGLLAAVYLGLAELQLLIPPLVTALTLIGVSLAIYPLRSELRGHGVLQTHPRRQAIAADDLFIALPALAVVLLALLYSSSRLSYDSVALYFSNAKATAMAHSIRYFMDDSFVVSMFHTGILYSALIQLAGDQAARMYSWLSGAVLLILSLALGEALGLRRSALAILLALIVSSTFILDLMGDGKIDLASATPGLAALFLLVTFAQRLSLRDCLLIGFMAGMAIIDRPYYGIILGLLFAAFLWRLSRHGNSDASGRVPWHWPGVLLRIGVGASPWIVFHLVSNWAILGSPLAFMNDILGAMPGRWQWALPAAQLGTYRLLYPGVVTLLNTPQSLGTISPAFLAFLPLVLLRVPSPSSSSPGAFAALVRAAAATLLMWICFTFVVFEIRYVMLLWILLFMPVAAWSAAALTSSDPVLRIGTRSFIAILMAFLAFRVVYISLDTYSPVDAQGTAQCTGLATCDFLRPLNAVAAPGERVLTLAAFRYYLRDDLLACSTTNAEYSVLRDLASQDMNAFWTEVYRRGYRYLAFERNYTLRHLYFGTEPGPGNTPPWLRLVPIAGRAGEAQVAYRMEFLSPPALARAACVQDGNAIWAVAAPDPQ